MLGRLHPIDADGRRLAPHRRASTSSAPDDLRRDRSLRRPRAGRSGCETAPARSVDIDEPLDLRHRGGGRRGTSRAPRAVRRPRPSATARCSSSPRRASTTTATWPSPTGWSMPRPTPAPTRSSSRRSMRPCSPPRTRATAAYQRAAARARRPAVDARAGTRCRSTRGRALQRHARDRGIAFLSSPFDEGSADLLDRLDVPGLQGPVRRAHEPAVPAGSWRAQGPAAAGLDGDGRHGRGGRCASTRSRAAGTRRWRCSIASRTTRRDPADANLRAIGDACARPSGCRSAGPITRLGIELAGAAAALGAEHAREAPDARPVPPGPDHRASLEPDGVPGDGGRGAGRRGRARRRRQAAGSGEAPIAARRPQEPPLDAVDRDAGRARWPPDLARPAPGDRLCRPRGSTTSWGARTRRRPCRAGQAADPGDVEADERIERRRRAAAADDRGPHHRPPGLGHPPVDLRGAPRPAGPRPAARGRRHAPRGPLRPYRSTTSGPTGSNPTSSCDWLGADADVPAEAQAAGVPSRRSGPPSARRRPTPLVLAGDRFETAAAAVAATLARVPIAHIHGGEQTGGAFDDPLRHAITKLSHLHLVSSEEHARRVVRLGEDPATVHVVGPRGSTPSHGRTSPTGRSWRRALGIPLDGRRWSSSRSSRSPSTPTRRPSPDPILEAMDRVAGDLCHDPAERRSGRRSHPRGGARGRAAVAGSRSRRSASGATGA